MKLTRLRSSSVGQCITLARISAEWLLHKGWFRSPCGPCHGLSTLGSKFHRDSYGCDMRVESDGTNVVFLLNEGALETRWLGTIVRKRLKITGMIVTRKNVPSRVWSNVKASGDVTADKLSIRWSWHWEGAQKSVNEDGTLILQRVRQ